MAVNNAIVVSKVQQKGRKLILVETNEVSYQHSADLLIELQMETGSASPFNGLLIEAMGKPAGNEHSYHCPIIEETGKKYIMLSSDVLKEQGILKLSIGGINDEKLVVSSNTIDLCIDESNGIISKMSPTEKYWQIEVRNAMRYWYETQVKPDYDSMRIRLEKAEVGRVSAETTRVSSENTRINNESTRVANENLRRTAESNRVTSENTRGSAEGNRNTAENARKSAEIIRVSNESTRANSESTRESNEVARRNAETNRAIEENVRVNADTSRTTAENNRVSAEATRINNETARRSAETSRGTAESARVAAEATRINSETNRSTAETARVAAETKRQVDTTTAVNRANIAAERCEDVADGNYATQADIQNLENTKFNNTGGKLEGDLVVKKGSVIKGVYQIQEVTLPNTLPISPNPTIIPKAATVSMDNEVDMISTIANGDIKIGQLNHKVSFETSGKIKVNNGTNIRTLAEEEEVLKLTGGTLTGNLTLKSAGNFGNRINFGDGDYVHIAEPTDDTLELKGSTVNIVNSDGATVLQVANGAASYKGNELFTKAGGQTINGNLTIGANGASTLNFGGADNAGLYASSNTLLNVYGTTGVRIGNSKGGNVLSVEGNIARYNGTEIAKKSDLTSYLPNNGGTLSGALTINGNTKVTGNITTTGNLTLKGGANYGNKLNFGDGDLVHLYEKSDDLLEVKASTINITNTDGGSTLKVNGSKAYYNNNEVATVNQLKYSKSGYVSLSNTGLTSGVDILLKNVDSGNGTTTVYVNARIPSIYGASLCFGTLVDSSNLKRNLPISSARGIAIAGIPAMGHVPNLFDFGMFSVGTDGKVNYSPYMNLGSDITNVHIVAMVTFTNQQVMG